MFIMPTSSSKTLSGWQMPASMHVAATAMLLHTTTDFDILARHGSIHALRLWVLFADTVLHNVCALYVQQE